MKIYVATVKEVDDRAVLVESDFMPLTQNLVHPALDGVIKMTPPAVDDQVLVFDLDSSNAVRWFIPINLDFSNDDTDYIQIGNATDFVVLASMFVTMFNQHTHSTAVGLSGPPAPTTESAVAATKVKAE